MSDQRRYPQPHRINGSRTADLHLLPGLGLDPDRRQPDPPPPGPRVHRPPQLRGAHPLAEIAEVLAEDCPACSLESASLLWERLRPREGRWPHAAVPAVAVERFIDDLATVRRPEAAVLLTLLGHLAGDDPFAPHLLAVAAHLAQPMPAWLVQLGQARVTEALEFQPSGCGDHHLLAVRLADGPDLTVVLGIHRWGEEISGYTVAEPMEQVLRSMHRPGDDRTSLYREVDLAEVPARIEQDIDGDERQDPPTSRDPWPRNRPLLAWVARLLPTGGFGYGEPAYGWRFGHHDREPLLADVVGGYSTLLDLSAAAIAPLPDEPLAFDLATLSEDQRPSIERVVAIVDEASLDLLGVEHRTACRRLLTRILEAKPSALIPPKARLVSSAAAVVSLIASANHDMARQGGTLTPHDLAERFGVTNAASRSATLLKPLGLDVRRRRNGAIILGSPDLLVARRKREILAERDTRWHA